MNWKMINSMSTQVVIWRLVEYYGRFIEFRWVDMTYHLIETMSLNQLKKDLYTITKAQSI